jgi:hypothetical protein
MEILLRLSVISTKGRLDQFQVHVGLHGQKLVVSYSTAMGKLIFVFFCIHVCLNYTPVPSLSVDF